MYDYLKLELQEQHEVAITKGRFLQFKFADRRIYSLYALEKFFVELEYLSRTNDLEKITAFRAGHLLDRHTTSNLDFLLD